MPRSQAKAIYQQAIKTKAELVKLSRKIDKQKMSESSATTTQPENVALQQMKALKKKKRTELADLNFLLRFPELCPRTGSPICAGLQSSGGNGESSPEPQEVTVDQLLG